MFFEKLSIKGKNIITMVVSGVVSVTHIALYLYLYLKRQQLFSEYGTTDVTEIVNKIPVFEPTPYELSIEYVFDMRFNLFIAAISLSIFIFSLVEFIKSRKKKNNANVGEVEKSDRLKTAGLACRLLNPLLDVSFPEEMQDKLTVFRTPEISERIVFDSGEDIKTNR